MSTPSGPAAGSGGWGPRPGYQRGGLPASGAPAGRAGAPATSAHGAASPAPGWAAPLTRHRRRGDVAKYVIAVVGGLGLLIMLGLTAMNAGGSSHVILPVALAMIPLVIVLAAVFWIDRWEPEPFGVLLAAFLWGAGVATVISLVVNTTASVLVASSTGDPSGGELVSAVVSAPLIEESTKGLGVLIIYLIWRRTFNGPVDGIVYAAVVAGGFAFAENVLYFVQYSDSLMQTFLMRAVFSPFAHVTFTACTGLAIGVSSRMRSRLAWLWMTPIGLVAAMMLHAFWNGVISVAPGLYLLVEVPFFLACVALVIWLRWSERMTMRQRLMDYARAGWFDPAEITMLTTGSGRSAARRWARGRGPVAAQAMKEFQTSTAALAQLRQQGLDGHAEADYATTERELLDSVAASRRVFLARG